MATDAAAVGAIRAPNHLGDLILALPALRAAGEATIVVAAGLAPLVAAEFGDRIIPFKRGRAGFLRAARALRARRPRTGILLPPSFSSALLFRAGGVHRLRGLDTDGRGLLLADRVPRARFDALHRAAGYLMLVTGADPVPPPVPTLAVADGDRTRAETLFEGSGRLVGVFPGSNASSRRWPRDRFRALARQLVEGGDRVAVFGGPGERELTAFVAGDHALDLGGRTDLPLLAAALASCDILVTNDSGPMHLAGAVGTPVVALMGAGDPAATGPLGPVRELLFRADLPCVPCVKNACPRTGTGFLLPEAERECLRLIEVPVVLRAAAPKR